jgi:GMP synthase-like glutamine amidotransferase
MHIHWIQHVPFEGLGNIEEWITKNNHQLTCTKQFAGDPLPELNNFDLLIVMGGPMGVYDTDQYAWLNDELLLIKQTIDANKPALGICLGSQFIAAALGAKVYPGPVKEIGWFPVEIKNKNILSFNETTPVVFHWHGDTFDLPEQAELVASTKEVHHQAFKYNKAIGLQFHLEQTEATIKQMLTNCGDELLAGGKKVQTSDFIQGEKTYFESNKAVMFKILDQLTK